MIPDQLSIQGMLNLLRTARQSKKRQNPGLQLVGLIFTKVLGYKTHDGTMAQLRGELGADLTRAYPEWRFQFFDTIIQQLKDGAEATEARSAAVVYRANSPHAASYWCFLAELVEKIGGPAKPLLPKVLIALEQAEAERQRLAQQRKEERGVLLDQ
jgi:cellulose biosynthesis protein BcsQ